MSGERIISVEEKFARLSVLEKSLGDIADDSPSVQLVKDSYTWLHQKLNDHLMHSRNNSKDLEQLISEYLAPEKLKSHTGNGYLRRDGAGFKLLLHFADTSIQPMSEGEDVTEEFALLERVLAEVNDCNKETNYLYFKRLYPLKSINKLAELKHNMKKLLLIRQYGLLYQEATSSPDLATAILKMLECDLSDFASHLIENVWLSMLLLSPGLKTEKKDKLKEVTKENIEKAIHFARLLNLNILFGVNDLLDLEFRKTNFIHFEVSIKKNAIQTLGFR